MVQRKLERFRRVATFPREQQSDQVCGVVIVVSAFPGRHQQPQVMSVRRDQALRGRACVFDPPEEQRIADAEFAPGEVDVFRGDTKLPQHRPGFRDAPLRRLSGVRTVGEVDAHDSPAFRNEPLDFPINCKLVIRMGKQT